MATKINIALSQWQSGEVHSLKWFKDFGITSKDLYTYSKSGLLKKLGRGVYMRPQDQLNWQAAIHCIQYELESNLLVSGITALYLDGVRQNVVFDKMPVFLQSSSLDRLPPWLLRHNWQATFKLKKSKLFNTSIGTYTYEQEGVPLRISSRERAILEFIHRENLSYSFESIINHLESLRDLRASVLQELLESCNSNKVKRVFLYLCERLSLPFFKELNLRKVNLGKGNRVVFRGGVLEPKYMITVPPIEESPF